jgi:hypothetical protein
MGPGKALRSILRRAIEKYSLVVDLKHYQGLPPKE